MSQKIHCQALGDDSAHNRTGDEGQAGDAAKDSHRLCSLLRWEGRAQQCQRQRCHQRGSASLDGAGGNQPDDVMSKRTGRRCSNKQQEASDEHAPPPEAVAQGSRRNEQHREAQGVGVHSPLQIRNRDAQVPVNRGKRGRDDRGIERNHK